MIGLIALLMTSWALGCSPSGTFEEAGLPEHATRRVERLDELAALWGFYKFHYIDDGRVISLDEDRITTSEGQGYAMLRAVWSDDEETFERVWSWTQRHLAREDDRLFSWKWKGRVLDRHAATDADTDIALSLLLAARRFAEPDYAEQALAIIRDIWEKEILVIADACHVTAGDWVQREPVPVIHVGYLAPYAYAEFAKIDSEHPWSCVADTAYDVLRWIYVDNEIAFPPERIYLDRETGALQLESPDTRRVGDFGYDVFPIFWRIALDAHWHWRMEGALRERMLAPLRTAYERDGRLFDRARPDGRALSELEALPLYATVHSLAEVADPDFAHRLRDEKLEALWKKAIAGKETPYYLHNWLAFDETLSLGLTRRFDEFLGFLRPFDMRTFESNFPTLPFVACLILFPLVRLTRGTRWQRPLLAAFLLAAFAVCLRYLAWRGLHSLNFIEQAGPVISVSLWIAELYCFASVLLLVVQVGLRGVRERERPEAPGFTPSVDILVPIFREPLEILERTILAARAIDYPNTEIHVLDDGHREEVRELARRQGVHYRPGPRAHAKAGNLNQALSETAGELVAIFDTDHVPTSSFLAETVPFFHDPTIGFVQTPHHFRNPDVFQLALRVSGRVPNEQDMFNHGMQSRRDSWGGAFFVGSGAIFRRAALESVGGFKLLSITEDIHTSQHLHAAGWRSAFVNQDLAVGLAAEDLASYIVQRRRWMLGCLQIFFRDNPLFCRGLPLRQRLGYFASLYYFFFPLARVVFWITPLYYLLFHLHPILSEVSVLTALLIPYLVVLPMISAALLPEWPRPFWGPFYENAVSAPLARSVFDLLLPKSLGFQVTPKGLTRETHRFDWRSARWTLVLVALTAIAIAKGVWELVYFGIEKDAYLFNLAWSGYNLLFLVGGLMLAWERPQRRHEERVERVLPIRLDLGGGEPAIEARTRDLGLGGCSLELGAPVTLPDAFDIELCFPSGKGIRLRTGLVYHERIAGRVRIGLRFLDPSPETHRALFLAVFADPATWARAHERQARSQLAATATFLWAFASYFRPARVTRRHAPRRLRLRRIRRIEPDGEHTLWLRDASARGLGLMGTGEPPALDQPWRIRSRDASTRWGRTVHAERCLLFFWRAGIELVADPNDGEKRVVELAI